MKKIFLPLIILAIFMLGSCTETIYEEVIKRDTVRLPAIQTPGPTQFVKVTETKQCETTDTLKIEIELADIYQNGHFQKDSVLSLTTACHALITINGYTLVPRDTVVKDSIIVNNTVTVVEKIVTVHDTLWQTKVEQRVINQTEYIFPGRSVNYIPTDLQKWVDEFVSRCTNCPGGSVIITYVPKNQLPGDNWTSNTFEMSGDQQIIQLDETLIWEESKAVIFREMARWQLRKQYTTDATKILCPWFRTSPEPTSQEINILFQ